MNYNDLYISRPLTYEEHEAYKEFVYDVFGTFWIFAEAYIGTNVDVELYNGTIQYSTSPVEEILWAFDLDSLYLSNDTGVQYSLSTLRYLIDYFLAPRNIKVNGTVIFVNNRFRKVFYYSISDNHIQLHVNRSNDCTNLLQGAYTIMNSDNGENSLTIPQRNLMLQVFAAEELTSFNTRRMYVDYIDLFSDKYIFI